MPRPRLRVRRAALATSLVVACFGASGCDPGKDAPEAEVDGFRVLSQPVAEAKATALPKPAIWEEPLDDPFLEQGRVVWSGTCITCHSTGLGGAPLIGNRDLWRPRLAQGLDVLFEHARDGFYGEVGEMPARGGNEALTDDEVRAAVHFMATRAMM